MVETKPMNYAVSRDTVVLYIFPLLSSTRPRVVYAIRRLHRYTGTLHTVYFFPKRVQTYQQSTALPAFSTNCRVFYINISGLPRIEPAAPIRLATTDQRRNQLRHRATLCYHTCKA